MKSQISNFKFQIFLTLFLLFTIHCSLVTAAEWSGVDESVIEKYAKEHGREAVAPLINTDQGDLLLFVFLLAGTIGGFAAGYYWRTLTEQRAKNADVIKKNI
jgi:cobalt/nickel transport protein